MKRFLLSILCVLLASLAFVSADEVLTASTGTVDLEVYPGDDGSVTFTVTNNGTVALTNFSALYVSDDGNEGKFEDNDNDDGTVTLTGLSSLTLDQGDSETVTVSVDTDNELDTKTYDGTVTVSATDEDNTAHSQAVTLSVKVTPQICEEGKQGDDFAIDIEQPEDDDEFLPGDTIPLEVSVDNLATDDLDVVVEATLYNVDKGRKEATAKTDGTINEDESETFKFDLELPTDLDDGDDYELYVQVHEDGNEDDSCDFEKVSIDVERDNEDAQLSDVSVSPSSGLVCSSPYTVSFTVESLGTAELKNLYIQLLDGDLAVDESSDTFDIGDYNDDDNSKNVDFDLTVPEDLDQGTYTLEAVLYDDNGDMLDDVMVPVDVDACGVEMKALSSSASALDVVVADSYDVAGDELTLPFLIRNLGDTAVTYDVAVEDVSWATLDGAEYVSSLQSGAQVHGYLYFTLDSTTTGKHDMTITVTDSDGNSVSKIVTVDFGEASSEENDAFFSGVSGWFTQEATSAGSFWVLADVILVILALVFVRLLFSKK